MKKRNIKKPAVDSFRITTTQDFLGLSDEEMALIDLKISLISKVKAMRQVKNVTQQQLAQMIESSQPRVAMLERGSPDVSLDLICRALFALGVSRRDLGKTISSNKAA